MNSIFFPRFISNRTLKDRGFFFFFPSPIMENFRHVQYRQECSDSIAFTPLATDSAVNRAGLPSFVRFCFSVLK